MSIDPNEKHKSLTISYRDIMGMNQKAQREILKKPAFKEMLSELSPAKRIELFPGYYRKDLDADQQSILSGRSSGGWNIPDVKRYTGEDVQKYIDRKSRGSESASVAIPKSEYQKVMEGAGVRSSLDERSSGSIGSVSGNKSNNAYWTPERQKFAINYLMEKGNISRAGATSAVARWRWEAPKGPSDSNNMGGGHWGIVQWGSDRVKVLEANGHNIRGEGSTVTNQLDAFIWEGNNVDYEKPRFKALQEAGTLADGARAMADIERAEDYNRNGYDTLRDQTEVTANQIWNAQTMSNPVEGKSFEEWKKQNPDGTPDQYATAVEVEHQKTLNAEKAATAMATTLIASGATAEQVAALQHTLLYEPEKFDAKAEELEIPKLVAEKARETATAMGGLERSDKSTGQGNLVEKYPIGEERLFVSGGTLEGVDPRLIHMVKEGSKDLPPGYRAEMISGKDSRDMGTKNHPSGLATDWIIYDDKGKQLSHNKYGPDWKTYEKFYQSVNVRGKELYPDVETLWGGAWNSSAAGPGDPMHIQIKQKGVGSQSMRYDPETGLDKNHEFTKLGNYYMSEKEVGEYRSGVLANIEKERELAESKIGSIPKTAKADASTPSKWDRADLGATPAADVASTQPIVPAPENNPSDLTLDEFASLRKVKKRTDMSLPGKLEEFNKKARIADEIDASEVAPVITAAKGAEFVTDKATPIVAGEAGKEHVKITPLEGPNRPRESTSKDTGPIPEAVAEPQPEPQSQQEDQAQSQQPSPVQMAMSNGRGQSQPGLRSADIPNPGSNMTGSVAKHYNGTLWAVDKHSTLMNIAPESAIA
tara:strand:+ start:72820 stop:75276 length:2457 start_codon:yes stop_codon:yes gene_type:complete